MRYQYLTRWHFRCNHLTCYSNNEGEWGRKRKKKRKKKLNTWWHKRRAWTAKANKSSGKQMCAMHAYMHSVHVEPFGLFYNIIYMYPPHLYIYIRWWPPARLNAPQNMVKYRAVATSIYQPTCQLIKHSVSWLHTVPRSYGLILFAIKTFFIAILVY